jgi:hypothetical protein
MGWTGRAPAPDGTLSARGAGEEKEHHHASHDHHSRSDRHWNRYGQEQTSHDWPRFARRPYWLGDVLELRRAEIADFEIEPRFHLTVGILGKTDSAGLGDAF